MGYYKPPAPRLLGVRGGFFRSAVPPLRPETRWLLAAIGPSRRRPSASVTTNADLFVMRPPSFFQCCGLGVFGPGKHFRLHRSYGWPESQRSFTNILNRCGHQSHFHNSSVTQATYIADLGAGLFRSLEEGVFDETHCSLDLYRPHTRVLQRLPLRALASEAPHRRHLLPSRADARARWQPSLETIPATTYPQVISSSPGRRSGAAFGGIPGPPGIATPAPPGTKISTPK